ncbi:MAG: hypothetical protein WCP93_03555 [Candidatus Berkelbacteria bacterium]
MSKQIWPKKRKNINFSLFVLLALVVFVFILLVNAPKKNASQIPDIPFTHKTITNNEASRFLEKQILPIIKSDYNNQIPSIKIIIQQLEKMEKTKKIEIGIATTYRGDSLAATYPVPINNMIWLTFSAPRLMDYQNNMDKRVFNNLVTITTCHEALHLMNDPIFTQKLYKKHLSVEKMDQYRLNGEAMIWGLTIEKVINPLLAKNKLTIRPQETEAAQIYGRFGNDYKNPDWVNWIKNNRFQTNE